MLQSPPSPQNNVETISSPTRLPRVGVYFTDAGTQLGKLLFNIVFWGRGEPSKVCHKHGRLFRRHRYPRNAMTKAREHEHVKRESWGCELRARIKQSNCARGCNTVNVTSRVRVAVLHQAMQGMTIPMMCFNLTLA